MQTRQRTKYGNRLSTPLFAFEPLTLELLASRAERRRVNGAIVEAAMVSGGCEWIVGLAIGRERKKKDMTEKEMRNATGHQCK